MSMIDFSLETLHELFRGAIAHDVNEALIAAAKDCIERGDITSARSVLLKISVKPNHANRAAGPMARLRIDFEIDARRPKLSVVGCEMFAGGDGQMRFSPEQVDYGQMTIDEIVEPTDVTLKMGVAQ